MNKKYKVIQDETIHLGNHILHRIQACRSFGNVKSGDLGGFIESEGNLDHSGGCWISEHTKIYGNARVFGDAYIGGSTWISGDAEVSGTAQVYDNSWVSGNVQISGDAWIGENIPAYGNMKLDSGIWNQTVEIDEKCYLISTTLKKVLFE